MRYLVVAYSNLLNSKLLSIFTLLLSAFLAFQVYISEREQQELKSDLIELSKVKYGLFNVDEWKEIISDILSKKVNEFNLTGANKDTMREKVSAFLYAVLNDFEHDYYQKQNKTLVGWIQGGVASATGTFGRIKEQVPQITDDVLNFLDDQENRESIKKFILKKLNEYTDNTFSKVDYSDIESINSKYEQATAKDTVVYLEARIKTLEASAKFYKYALMLLGVLICAFLIWSKAIERNTYLLCSLVAMLFLICGIALPMIELDARISQITFTLLDEPVSFTDQVLFYKSKSIVEVFSLLVSQGKLDMMLVGLLVVVFSVLFPISKLISSWIYLFTPAYRKHKLIDFMVFKTGKWSMADVMVVAILMSYIGFSGIIGEQLSQLESIALDLDVLTTNNSKLLFGFFSFALFVIISLLISHRLRFDGVEEENTSIS